MMRNGLKVCNSHTEKHYVALTPSLGQSWEEWSPFGCPGLDEGCGDKTDDKQHQSCRWTRTGGGAPSPPCSGLPPSPPPQRRGDLTHCCSLSLPQSQASRRARAPHSPTDSLPAASRDWALSCQLLFLPRDQNGKWISIGQPVVVCMVQSPRPSWGT